MIETPYITRHYVNPDKKVGNTALNLNLFIDSQVFMFALFNNDYTELLELCDVRINQSMQQQNNPAERVNFLINNYQLNKQQFKHVNISVLNNDFTLIPEAFALKEHTKEILGFSLGQQPKNTFTHLVNNLNFSYTIEAELSAVLERNFKNSSIRHSGAVAINLLFNNRSLKKCEVFINVNEGVVELLAKDDIKFIYYNVFEFENNEDILYFVTFMMEQFNINPEKARIIIAGQCEVESELHLLLKKYIRHISFAVNSIGVNTLETPTVKIPEHFYFTLLNQHLCEL